MWKSQNYEAVWYVDCRGILTHSTRGDRQISRQNCHAPKSHALHSNAWKRYLAAVLNKFILGSNVTKKARKHLLISKQKTDYLCENGNVIIGIIMPNILSFY